jgi:ABC-type glycerol-3-phosphate transport system permease component
MRKNKNAIRMAADDKVLSVISHIIVISLAFFCFYPIWYVILNSMITGDAAKEGVYIFPRLKQFYFGTYGLVFKNDHIYRSLLLSGARVVLSTVLCVTFSSMFAFLVSRPQLPIRLAIYRFAIVTMYVSGGLIPWYLMMRTYGLTNNFATYIIPGMLSAWFVILIKTYIESAIPGELDESARIDGANFYIIFFKIIMPLCKPILATCALFNAVGAWNTYFDNYLLVSRPELQTIQMVLWNAIQRAEALASSMRQIAASGGIITKEMDEMLKNNMTANSVRNATTIVSMLPIMMIYPFLQKYFAKGIMLGAVKG